jgi:hypothetical protein
VQERLGVFHTNNQVRLTKNSITEAGGISFVLISKVNKTRESATFGILLPRNLSKPREKRVIVEQLIKDVIVSIKGQKKKDIIVTFLCFDLKK